MLELIGAVLFLAGVSLVFLVIVVNIRANE